MTLGRKLDGFLLVFWPDLSGFYGAHLLDHQVFDFTPEFKKTTLDCGVRVVTEHHPYSRATCTSVYVMTGSRDEGADMNGAAHFLEHLVFKGTENRTAYELASVLEAVGGELNAYTTKEFTCFHAATLREHTSLSLDVLLDLAQNAKFTQDDFDRERQVVEQEIDMSEEQFEELIFDLYFERVYQGHPLAQPILGTKQSLRGMTPDQIMSFYRSRYGGERMIVSVAGSVDHDTVVKEVRQRLKGVENPVQVDRHVPKAQSFIEIIKKPSEQAHILVGFPSPSIRDAQRFDAYLVNTLLGGGMTSRFYQRLREELGLVYSVYSYLHSFTDAGLQMLYAATSPELLPQALEAIQDEFKKLRDTGVTQTEIDFFKQQLRGQLLLAADDIENRMNSIAANEMVFGEYRSVESVIADVETVSQKSVQEFLDKYIDSNYLGVMLLGNFEASSIRPMAEKVFSR